MEEDAPGNTVLVLQQQGMVAGEAQAAQRLAQGGTLVKIQVHYMMKEAIAGESFTSSELTFTKGPDGDSLHLVNGVEDKTQRPVRWVVYDKVWRVIAYED